MLYMNITSYDDLRDMVNIVKFLLLQKRRGGNKYLCSHPLYAFEFSERAAHICTNSQDAPSDKLKNETDVSLSMCGMIVHAGVRLEVWVRMAKKATESETRERKN